MSGTEVDRIRQRYEACREELDGGGLPVDMLPDHRADVSVLLAEIDRLERVAIAGRDVLTTLHERFREDIDFVPLWRALIEAGLMTVDPADWVGEEMPKPPGEAT